jgi:biopolymer transport protein ExbB/TolQ
MSEETLPDTRLARMAAVLCAAPFAGAVLTALDIMRALDGTVPLGTGDPSVLREKIGGTLYPVAIGILLALVGLPMAYWCIFRKRQRPWYLVAAVSFATFIFAWIILHGSWILLTRPESAS